VEAAEAQKQLDADYAKLEQENAAELARLTPEVRAQVKKLVASGTGGIKSAVNAAVKGPQRRPGHADRDAQRHPVQTLEFLGVQPNHKVLEYGPGEGWYTELLAPALAKRGKLYVTLANPEGPKTDRSTYYGKRTQLQLDSLPEAYSTVERSVINPAQPGLTIEGGSLDAVLLFRGAHGMVNGGSFQTWLNEFHRVLEPKGILGIEQHRAAAGADPLESSKRGYLPEAFVIAEAEKAGFKLAAKSELNANPKDTKDYPDGVWALPPTLGGNEADRAKYVAIGESDRMTLKFIKVEHAKVAAPAAAPAANAPAGGTAPTAAPSTATAPAAPTTSPATPTAK
jgi:predicted methyltransferase